MTAPSVGGSAVPLTTSSGAYNFQRQELRQAGAGNWYGAGLQRIEWTFPAMGTTEWDWWWTQYLRGTAMSYELWTDDTRRTTQDFTRGWLLRPACIGIEAGYYRDVTITITHLEPIVTGA